MQIVIKNMQLGYKRLQFTVFGSFKLFLFFTEMSCQKQIELDKSSENQSFYIHKVLIHF